MARHRLTDQQWELIRDVFPNPAATGRPPVDPRYMIDGILWRLRTGSPWRDLPEEFGPWKTVYNHFDKWNGDGTLDKVKRRLLQRIVDDDGIDNELTTSNGDEIAWPIAISGDKGYRSDWIDEMLLEMGITPVIPSKKNEDRSTRAVQFDKELYRQRNIVERVIGWLKECRCVFARYEKTAINFCGMVKMAMIHRYLKLLAP